MYFSYTFAFKKELSSVDRRPATQSFIVLFRVSWYCDSRISILTLYLSTLMITITIIILTLYYICVCALQLTLQVRLKVHNSKHSVIKIKKKLENSFVASIIWMKSNGWSYKLKVIFFFKTEMLYHLSGRSS